TGSRAAREGDQSYAWILDEDLRDLDVAGNDVGGAIGVAGRLYEIEQPQRRERVLGRRLERDRRAAGHGGRDFVSREQDRKVERRDRRDRRQWKAARDGDPARARGDDIGREYFTADPCGLFGSIAEHGDGAIDFGLRLCDR